MGSGIVQRNPPPGGAMLADFDESSQTAFVLQRAERRTKRSHEAKAEQVVLAVQTQSSGEG